MLVVRAARFVQKHRDRDLQMTPLQAMALACRFG